MALELAIDQIALEGRHGCSIARLWELMESECGLPAGQAEWRTVLWMQLLRAGPRLSFYVVPPGKSPAPHLDPQLPREEEGKGEDKEGKEDKEDKGKKVKKDRRRDPKKEDEEGRRRMLAVHPVSPLSPELKDWRTAQDGNVYLVADEPTRHRSIGIQDECLSFSVLSEVMLNTLEVVGAARAQGAIQTLLAKQFDLDPQAYHYIIRALAARGLVRRTKSIIHGEFPHGIRTGVSVKSMLVVLTRFAQQAWARYGMSDEAADDAEDGDQPPIRDLATAPGHATYRAMYYDPDLVARRVCEVLALLPTRTMLEQELKVALDLAGPDRKRDWANTRNKLVKLGYLERFQGVASVDRRGGMVDAVVWLVKLIKEWDQSRTAVAVLRGEGEGEEAAEEEEEEEEEEGEGEAGAAAKPTKFFGHAGGMMEESRIMTALHLIVDAGAAGIKSMDWAHTMGYGAKKAGKVYKELKDSGVQFTPVNEGRVKFYILTASPELRERLGLAPLDAAPRRAATQRPLGEEVEGAAQAARERLAAARAAGGVGLPEGGLMNALAEKIEAGCMKGVPGSNALAAARGEAAPAAGGAAGPHVPPPGDGDPNIDHSLGDNPMDAFHHADRWPPIANVHMTVEEFKEIMEIDQDTFVKVFSRYPIRSLSRVARLLLYARRYSYMWQGIIARLLLADEKDPGVKIDNKQMKRYVKDIASLGGIRVIDVTLKTGNNPARQVPVVCRAGLWPEKEDPPAELVQAMRESVQAWESLIRTSQRAGGLPKNVQDLPRIVMGKAPKKGGKGGKGGAEGTPGGEEGDGEGPVKKEPLVAVAGTLNDLHERAQEAGAAIGRKLSKRVEDATANAERSSQADICRHGYLTGQLARARVLHIAMLQDVTGTPEAAGAAAVAGEQEGRAAAAAAAEGPGRTADDAAAARPPAPEGEEAAGPAAAAKAPAPRPWDDSDFDSPVPWSESFSLNSLVHRLKVDIWAKVAGLQDTNEELLKAMKDGLRMRDLSDKSLQMIYTRQSRRRLIQSLNLLNRLQLLELATDRSVKDVTRGSLGDVWYKIKLEPSAVLEDPLQYRLGPGDDLEEDRDEPGVPRREVVLPGKKEGDAPETIQVLRRPFDFSASVAQGRAYWTLMHSLANSKVYTLLTARLSPYCLVEEDICHRLTWCGSYRADTPSIKYSELLGRIRPIFERDLERFFAEVAKGRTERLEGIGPSTADVTWMAQDLGIDPDLSARTLRGLRLDYSRRAKQGLHDMLYRGLIPTGGGAEGAEGEEGKPEGEAGPSDGAAAQPRQGLNLPPLRDRLLSRPRDPNQEFFGKGAMGILSATGRSVHLGGPARSFLSYSIPIRALRLVGLSGKRGLMKRERELDKDAEGALSGEGEDEEEGDAEEDEEGRGAAAAAAGGAPFVKRRRLLQSPAVLTKQQPQTMDIPALFETCGEALPAPVQPDEETARKRNYTEAEDLSVFMALSLSIIGLGPLWFQGRQKYSILRRPDHISVMQVKRRLQKVEKEPAYLNLIRASLRMWAATQSDREDAEAEALGKHNCLEARAVRDVVNTVGVSLRTVNELFVKELDAFLKSDKARAALEDPELAPLVTECAGALHTILGTLPMRAKETVQAPRAKKTAGKGTRTRGKGGKGGASERQGAGPGADGDEWGEGEAGGGSPEPEEGPSLGPTRIGAHKAAAAGGGKGGRGRRRQEEGPGPIESDGGEEEVDVAEAAAGPGPVEEGEEVGVGGAAFGRKLWWLRSLFNQAGLTWEGVRAAAAALPPLPPSSPSPSSSDDPYEPQLASNLGALLASEHLRAIALAAAVVEGAAGIQPAVLQELVSTLVERFTPLELVAGVAALLAQGTLAEVPRAGETSIVYIGSSIRNPTALSQCLFGANVAQRPHNNRPELVAARSLFSALGGTALGDTWLDLRFDPGALSRIGANDRARLVACNWESVQGVGVGGKRGCDDRDEPGRAAAKRCRGAELGGESGGPPSYLVEAAENLLISRGREGLTTRTLAQWIGKGAEGVMVDLGMEDTAGDAAACCSLARQCLAALIASGAAVEVPGISSLGAVLAKEHEGLRGSGATPITVSPWGISGRVDPGMIGLLTARVVDVAVRYPGVAVPELARRLADVGTPGAIRLLLDVLEQEGIVELRAAAARQATAMPSILSRKGARTAAPSAAAGPGVLHVFPDLGKCHEALDSADAVSAACNGIGLLAAQQRGFVLDS